MPLRLYRHLTLLVTVCVAAGEPSGGDALPEITLNQQRSEKALGGGKLQYWQARPDQAEVLNAGFLGGAGHEWLVDGGFQPDGSLVLVGNVIGGEFALTVPVGVLGRDGAKPPAWQPSPVISKETKQPAKDVLGRTKYHKPEWSMPHVTGFVVRLDRGLKTVIAAKRLAWGGGAITSAEVGSDGSVYIAGKADAATSSLAGDHQDATVAIEGFKNPPCTSTFVARIAADLGGVEWVRTVQGPAYSPKLSLGRDGSLNAALVDVRRFDARGKLLGTAEVDGGLGDRNSVSPVDGSIVYGHEHMWGTGREPWRCPILNIKHPDGKLRYQLYDWGGPYVGLDNSRQVSDTAVRRVAHDSAGNILIQLWSDGGNSIGHQQPTDVRRSVGSRGVGLTTAGANATSFAYLVRIEPKNYQVTGWTLWCSQYGHKANGAGVDRIAEGPDGSFLFAGGTAWGLRQTPNRLARGEPGGSYIAVLTPDLTGVRYSSCVPGAGQAELGDESCWGICSGVVAGKVRAVYLGGAAADEDVYGLVTATPTVQPVQGTFGGGRCDGYYVVLDLGQESEPATVPLAKAGARMDWTRAASKSGGKDKAAPPADGTVFEFKPDSVKWVTVDAEFRHPDPVTWWPNFFYGKPVSGALTWAGGWASGSCTVACPSLCQPKGEQDRRILGELIRPDGLPLEFTIASLGKPELRTTERSDSKGNAVKYEAMVCRGEGELKLGGRTMQVKPDVVLVPGTVVEKGIAKLTVTAYVALTGKDLGMTGKAAEEPIDVRISMQGIQAGAGGARKK